MVIKKKRKQEWALSSNPRLSVWPQKKGGATRYENQRGHKCSAYVCNNHNASPIRPRAISDWLMKKIRASFFWPVGNLTWAHRRSCTGYAGEDLSSTKYGLYIVWAKKITSDLTQITAHRATVLKNYTVYRKQNPFGNNIFIFRNHLKWIWHFWTSQDFFKPK